MNSGHLNFELASFHPICILNNDLPNWQVIFFKEGKNNPSLTSFRYNGAYESPP
jgi:hypothetical protein